MSLFPLIFLILFILFFVGMFFCARFVAPNFASRYFTIILGIILLVVFVCGKYVWYVKDFIDYTTKGIVPEYLFVQNSDENGLIMSLLYSNLLLLNWSDLVTLLLGLTLLIWGNKAITKVISLFTIMIILPIGALTLANDMMSFNADINFYKSLQWWQYIFIGNGITRFHFISYMLLAFTSISCFVAAKQFSRWSMVSEALFMAFVFLYTIICVWAANVFFNASGFGVYDWGMIAKDNGQLLSYGLYNVVNMGLNNMLVKLSELNMDLFRIIYITIMSLVITIYIMFKNIFTNDITKMIYIYKPWYENNVLFRNWGYFVDAYINNHLWKHSNRNYLYAMRRNDFFLKLNELMNTKDLPSNLSKSGIELLNKISKKRKNNENDIKIVNEVVTEQTQLEQPAEIQNKPNVD